MSSNVSATNNIQRLPGVTVQADSSVSKKASKFSLEGKLLGIKKKTIILSAVGIAAILAVVYIAKNSNAKNRNKDDKEKGESILAERAYGGIIYNGRILIKVVSKTPTLLLGDMKESFIKNVLDEVCNYEFREEEAGADQTSDKFERIFYATPALKATVSMIEDELVKIEASGKGEDEDKDVATALKSVKDAINARLNEFTLECDKHLETLVSEFELEELDNAFNNMSAIPDKDKSDNMMLKAEVDKLETALSIIRDDLSKYAEASGKDEKFLKCLEEGLNARLSKFKEVVLKEISNKKGATQAAEGVEGATQAAEGVEGATQAAEGVEAK